MATTSAIPDGSGTCSASEFTADEAVEYMGVSIAAFRCDRNYRKQGKISASSILDTSRRHPLAMLHDLKQALRIV
ncbi:hypothetical protein [Collimonas arenae]|nr:hypothetical protein [Collimonas arenae]